MNPNLHQLQAFVRIFHLRSVTAAAREMHLTPSAVSLLVRQLEDMWSTRLFDRTTRALHPTVAAREAIAMAERLLSDAEHLNTNMRAVSELAHGRIRFAASASVASTVMPAILQRFSRDYPKIDMVIFDVAPDRLVPIVLSGEAELAIGTVSSAEVELTPLFTDRLAAICLQGSPLASRAKIEWAQLAGHPTISIRRGADIRTVIDEAMVRHKREFKPTYEVSLLTTSLAMTAQGLGTSILPSYLVPHCGYPSLVAVPLVAPVVKRNLSIITRPGRSLSPAGQKFVDAVRAVIESASG